MCCISLSVWACFAQAESDFVYKKVTSQNEIVDGGVYVPVGDVSSFYYGIYDANSNSIKANFYRNSSLTEFYVADACELIFEKLSPDNNNYNVFIYDENIKRYVYITRSSHSLSIGSFNDQNKNTWNVTVNENEPHRVNMSAESGYSLVYTNETFSNTSGKGTLINLYRKCQKINIASETGYTTLCSNHALDFTDTGVKAYTAEVTDNKVLLKQVTRISAQCPVILHGTKGTFTVNVTNAAPLQEDQSAIDSNALCGVTEESGLTVNGDKEYYALTEKEGKAVFAPVKQGVTIPKGKAYFALPKTSEAKSLSIVIEDDMTTSIPQPHLSSTPTQAYTLMGTRASDSYRGIVIINGKKHLVK